MDREQEYGHRVYDTADGWIVATREGERYYVTIRRDLRDGTGTDARTYFGPLASAHQMTWHFATRALALDAAAREPHASAFDQAIEHGRHVNLLTTDQAAATLGITRARVQQLVNERGWGHGTGRATLLTPEQVESLRDRAGVGYPAGRPRNQAPA